MPSACCRPIDSSSSRRTAPRRNQAAVARCRDRLALRASSEGSGPPLGYHQGTCRHVRVLVRTGSYLEPGGQCVSLSFASWTVVIRTGDLRSRSTSGQPSEGPSSRSAATAWASRVAEPRSSLISAVNHAAYSSVRDYRVEDPSRAAVRAYPPGGQWREEPAGQWLAAQVGRARDVRRRLSRCGPGLPAAGQPQAAGRVRQRRAVLCPGRAAHRAARAPDRPTQRELLEWHLDEVFKAS
jgi:hypothetical protein